MERTIVVFNKEKIVEAIYKAVGMIESDIENLISQADDLSTQEYGEKLIRLLLERERFLKELKRYRGLKTNILTKIKSFVLRMISRKNKFKMLLEGAKLIEITISICNNIKSFIGGNMKIQYRLSI